MIDDAVEQVQALTRLQAPDPWDRPGSTMTNGTAENTVASVNGQVVMVKYKGGEQKIIIGSDATIRKYVPGTKDELKAGAGRIRTPTSLVLRHCSALLFSFAGFRES